MKFSSVFDLKYFSANFNGPAVPKGLSSTEQIIFNLYSFSKYKTNHSIFSLLKPMARTTSFTLTFISY